MPTDDDLDGRIAATARSVFDEVQRSIDPELEYETFRRRAGGAALIELGATSIHHRSRWTMAAAAAVVVVAIAATAVLVGRGSDTDVVAPPPPPNSPLTTDESRAPATTEASTTTNPESALAQATPSVVAAGEQLTITPANFVERACLNIVTLTRRDDGSPRVSQIVEGRVSTSDTGTAVTYPECSGEYSDDGFTFIVPATLPPGPYEMCLTDDAAPAACALVDVTSATEAVRACASEPLTPPTLADGTAPGDVSIDTDTAGRSARWGGADATNRVVQILDTAVDPEPLDSALAAGRAFTAGTFRAAVQPVGDPPLGVISIFLRNSADGCLRWYLIGPGVFDDEASQTAQSWVEALDAASTLSFVPPNDPDTLIGRVLDSEIDESVPPPPDLRVVPLSVDGSPSNLVSTGGTCLTDCSLQVTLVGDATALQSGQPAALYLLLGSPTPGSRPDAPAQLIEDATAIEIGRPQSNVQLLAESSGCLFPGLSADLLPIVVYVEDRDGPIAPDRIWVVDTALQRLREVPIQAGWSCDAIVP